MSLDWIPGYRQGQYDGTKESEVVQYSWLEDLQHSIGEPWKSQGEERRQETQEDSQSQRLPRDGGEGAEEEDTKWADGG